MSLKCSLLGFSVQLKFWPKLVRSQTETMAKPIVRVFIPKEAPTDGDTDETAPTLLDGFRIYLPTLPGSDSRMTLEEAVSTLERLYYMAVHTHELLRQLHARFEAPVIAEAANSPLWEQMRYFVQTIIIEKLDEYIADRPQWESEKMRDVLVLILASDATSDRLNETLRLERWIAWYFSHVQETLIAMGCSIDPQLPSRWEAIAKRHPQHDYLFAADDVIGTGKEEDKSEPVPADQ